MAWDVVVLGRSIDLRLRKYRRQQHFAADRNNDANASRFWVLCNPYNNILYGTTRFCL